MIFGRLKVIFTSWLVFITVAFVAQENNYRAEFGKNSKLFYKHANQSQTDSALKYLQICDAIAKAHQDIQLNNVVSLQKAQYAKLTDDMNVMVTESQKALTYFSSINDNDNELDAAFLLISYYHDISMYDSAMFYCEKYIPLAIKFKKNKNLAVMYLVKGRMLGLRGKLNEAAEILREAIVFSEKTQNYINAFQCYVALSDIYRDFNITIALGYLNQASKIINKVPKASRNVLYTAFGNNYQIAGNYDTALYYYNLNLSLIDKTDKTHYGGMIGNIGNVYLEMGRYDEALEKQFESIAYFEQARDSLDIEIAYGTIGDIYLAKKKYSEALIYFIKATNMALRLGFTEELIYNYTGLYQCYEKLGKYKEAHESYKLYNKYKDSLRNVETTKKLTEQELNYRFENKQKEQKLIQEAKDQLTAEQIKNQRLTIYAGLGGGIILIVFLFLSVRNSNIRKRINSQLAQSHSEIQQQKNVIEHKNREITDSILYASRIQQGILPDTEEIKNLLPTSFLFYRPRDIVSGDFYWLKKLSGSDKVGFDDLVGIVVADCTGHGVPGAFMSFIGSTILNQTLNNKKVDGPATALNYLNEQLPLTLKSKIKSGQINDGMEAGICVINKTKNKLFFAGANLNLIHIRKGVINEIKGNKHSIGLNIEQRKTFTDNEINLEKGDCIYMFSDGYPDQFGGEKGKKYKYKNLLNFLNANSVLSPEEQFQKLSDNFDKWKGNLEQLDDVLLFGMKV